MCPTLFPCQMMFASLYSQTADVTSGAAAANLLEHRRSHKAALLSTDLRNLSVQRFCLHYKSQCLEKVDVKYVINRLWYEIFQIVPGIFFWPMLSFQPRYRDWYGSLELIPGSKCYVIIYIQKISRNHWKLITIYLCSSSDVDAESSILSKTRTQTTWILNRNGYGKCHPQWNQQYTVSKTEIYTSVPETYYIV